MLINLPSTAFLLECFRYEPLSGDLLWRERPLSHFTSAHRQAAVNTRCAGKRIATFKNGYLVVRLGKHLFKAHRIVWKMVYAEEPGLLDHINGNRADNRLENLRPCTVAQNIWNSRKSKNNTSGFKGVRQRTSRFEARIRTNGVHRSLGMFDTPDEAYAEYVSECSRLRGEFARTS